MKSLWMRCLFLGAILAAVSGPADAANAAKVKLVDMYAKGDGEQYRIHIIANGDISLYRSSRQVGQDTYKLTLDVPALPPTDSRYDLSTPFSKRFEVWPMMLENQIYCRITMELDLGSTSVIGMESPSRIFITISRQSPTAVAQVSEEATDQVPIKQEPAVIGEATEMAVGNPPEPVSDGVSPEPEKTGNLVAPEPEPPGNLVAPESVDSPGASGEPEPSADVRGTNEEFFSLFPAPAGADRPMFNVPIDHSSAPELHEGIRLGRFLVRPMLYASWVKGSNLIRATDADFADSAISLRARVAFDLLDADSQQLRFAYEGAFKNYGKFVLEDQFSHFLEVESELQLSPTMLLRLRDHFAQGSTESTEFDPGREVIFNTDPFLRNLVHGSLQYDFSERLGVELLGSYNQVHFLSDTTTFYDYGTTTTGASFLYHLSPLTTMFGQYQRSSTPAPVARPEAASTADAVLIGLRGEISALMTGTVRAGYQDQRFGQEGEELFYRGLVADVQLTRFFSEQTLLAFQVGRDTNLSNYEANGYYTTNRLTVQFVTPVWRELRLRAGGSLFDNKYPLPSVESGVPRGDRVETANLGIAYFFGRRSFFQIDYLFERRDSNLSSYGYDNNVIQFLVGWGFLSER